jgi:hypothetical protein
MSGTVAAADQVHCGYVIVDDVDIIIESSDLVSRTSFSSPCDSSSDDAWSRISSSAFDDCCQGTPCDDRLPNDIADNDIGLNSRADLGDEDCVATFEDLDDYEGQFFDWCDELEAHAGKSHGHSIRVLRNRAGEFGVDVASRSTDQHGPLFKKKM